ncbi:MAG: hypothetical protein ABW208_08850 [Pyrinomonadaceae bacterium]
MTPGAQMWERAHAAREKPEPTRNALAVKRRHDGLRARGLCIFCGSNPAPVALCGECQRRQSDRWRERYRESVERTGRTVRPYRRKAVRP